MTTTGIDLTPPAILDRAANVIQGWGDDKESSEARNEGFALGNRKRANDAAKKARSQK